LQLIKDAATNGTLADAPFYFDITRSWEYLEDAGRPREWLSKGMEESAQFLAKVGRGLVHYSTSTAGRAYTMRDTPEECLYNLEAILAAAEKHLAGDELNGDQRKLVAAVEQGTRSILSRRSGEESTDRKVAE
jgi:hypothetical protein